MNINIARQIECAKYERRLVAYIDMLGFKDLIAKSTADPSKVKDICYVLNLFYERFAQERLGRCAFGDSNRLSQFSDCFVVTSDPTAVAAEKLIRELRQIQIHCIMSGSSILLRGGVVLGDVYHSNPDQDPATGQNSKDEGGSLPFLFGPALVEAYEIEQKIAIAPRIVVTGTVVELVTEKLVTDLLVSDEDGLKFVNYLTPPEDVDFYANRGRRRVAKNEYFQEIHAMCDVNRGHPKPEVRQKYEWIEAKLSKVELPSGQSGK